MATYAFEGSEAAWVVRSFVAFHVAAVIAGVAWIAANEAAFFAGVIPAAATVIGFRTLKVRVDRRSITEAEPSRDRTTEGDYAFVEAAWANLGRRQPSHLRWMSRLTGGVFVGILVIAWWAGRIPGLTH